MRDLAAPPFVGRSVEIASLTRAIEAAAEGTGRAVVIEGEPGIGKTRLLAEAGGIAARSGLDVVAVVAHEFEESRPFGALLAAIEDDTLTRRASTAIHRLRQRFEDDRSTELHIVDAFVDVIEELATQRPVALMLDDLQWADPSTLVVVRVVARRMREMGVLVVTALRPLPRSRSLRRVIDVLLDDATHIRLDPLADSDVVRLVASTVGAHPGAALLERLGGAGGNPFFVIELTAAFAQEGVLVVADGRADVTTARVPARLRTTVLRRLGFLPDETTHALRAACVLGPTFSIVDLSVVANEDLLELAQRLQPAIAAGVLGEDGDNLAFRHDLVHDALYHDQPLAVRKALHRSAGQRLAAAGAPNRKIALQLALGAEIGDDDALGALDEAMVDASRRSIGAAAEFAKKGFALSVPGTGRHAEFAVWVSSLLYWAGAFDQAEDFAEVVLPTLSGPARPKVQFVLGASLEARGRLRQAVDHLDAAVADSESDLELPHLLAEAGFRYARLGDIDRAEGAARAARATASERGLPPVAAATMVLSQVAGARGSVADAVALGGEAVEQSRVHWRGGEWGYPFARLSHGWALVDADRIDEALQQFRQGRADAEARGVSSQIPLYHGGLAVACYLAGDLDEAMVEAESGLDLAADLGSQRATSLMSAMKARVLLHGGHLELAEATASAGEKVLAGRDPEFGGDLLRLSLGLAEEANGRTDAALAHLRAAWDISRPLRFFVVWRSLAAELVRLAVARRERELAERVTSQAADGAAQAPGVATAKGAALRCRGLLHDDADLLVQAVDAYRRGPRPVELALAAEDAARALNRRGDRTRSKALWLEALDLYDRSGASRDAGRVRNALRASGVRAPTTTSARSATTGWDSLTAAERRVVELVGRGLSNPVIAERLFISRRTVQAHLSHVFRKLNLTSRSQLIIEVAKRC